MQSISGTLTAALEVADSGPILVYDTATVAPGSSSTQNHAPGSPYKLRRVHVAAFGRVMWEIKTGPLGSETTKAVLFTDEGDVNADWVLDNPLQISATDNVAIVRTNMDAADLDVHSTIQAE